MKTAFELLLTSKRLNRLWASAATALGQLPPRPGNGLGGRKDLARLGDEARHQKARRKRDHCCGEARARGRRHGENFYSIYHRRERRPVKHEQPEHELVVVAA